MEAREDLDIEGETLSRKSKMMNAGLVNRTVFPQ